MMRRIPVLGRREWRGTGLAEGASMMSTTRSGFGVAAVMALLAGGCSDGGGTQATPGGTGGSGGPGGAASKGGASGSSGASGSGGEADGGAGKPSCDGTQTTDPKFAQAMKVLRDQLAKSGIPGGAIAIIKDGKLVDLGVAGSKRSAVCDPITPDTLFRTLSATSLITSIAALDAVEDGKLSLTAPITDAVPTLTVSNGNASDITLHHLLASSSMLHKDRSDADCTSLADGFASARNPVLWAKPGTMGDLDPTGMELAGLALENADKRPFADAVRARVLGPLAMGGAFDTATIEASDHSGGHSGAIEEGVQAGCHNLEPSTQYHGSIRDMAKLTAYLTGGAGQILDPSTLEAMLSRQGPALWSVEYTVYGARVYRFDVRDDLLSRNGVGWGFGMDVLIYQQRRLAVVVLVNARTEPWAVAEPVARIYDPTIKLAPPDYPFTPDPASLPSLVGTYKDALGVNKTGPRTLEVFLEPADSGKLAGTLTGSDGTSTPVSFVGRWSADNFDLRAGRSVEVRFWRDAAGNGYAISLDNDGKSGPPFFRAP
jgi:CubicO group peptidase (beta-lactamase class C family)